MSLFDEVFRAAEVPSRPFNPNVHYDTKVLEEILTSRSDPYYEDVGPEGTRVFVKPIIRELLELRKKVKSE